MPNDLELNNQGGFEEKPEQSQPPLDKNQKIAVAGLAVFAILIIVMWFAQLRSNIYGPFNAPAGQNQVATDAQNSDEALKIKDTDGDGLNDYDELNIYNTSPYLGDSDSDGFKDGEEIKNNADPNCPAGRECSGGLLDNSAVEQGAGATVSPEAGLNNLTNQNEILNNLLNQFGASQPQTQSIDGSGSLSSDQLNVLKNIDAVSLRQLLLQAGMPKETLDKISDTDLMKSYGETFSAGQ
ncbi:MAG: hypothetical protein V1801_01120 [Candidatus Falkowbacteria bacterium]